MLGAVNPAAPAPPRASPSQTASAPQPTAVEKLSARGHCAILKIKPQQDPADRLKSQIWSLYVLENNSSPKSKIWGGFSGQGSMCLSFPTTGTVHPLDATGTCFKPNSKAYELLQLKGEQQKRTTCMNQKQQNLKGLLSSSK